MLHWVCLRVGVGQVGPSQLHTGEKLHSLIFCDLPYQCKPYQYVLTHSM